MCKKICRCYLCAIFSSQEDKFILLYRAVGIIQHIYIYIYTKLTKWSAPSPSSRPESTFLENFSRRVKVFKRSVIRVTTGHLHLSSNFLQSNGLYIGPVFSPISTLLVLIVLISTLRRILFVEINLTWSTGPHKQLVNHKHFIFPHLIVCS